METIKSSKFKSTSFCEERSFGQITLFAWAKIFGSTKPEAALRSTGSVSLSGGKYFVVHLALLSRGAGQFMLWNATDKTV